MLMCGFIDYLKENKKWWLLPILVLIGIFGLVVAFAKTGATVCIYKLN